MPLYEVAAKGLQHREVAHFAELGLYERADLQRLLREQPAALGEDLLIVPEDFGQWEESRRRAEVVTCGGREPPRFDHHLGCPDSGAPTRL